jgi:hypothetical protein
MGCSRLFHVFVGMMSFGIVGAHLSCKGGGGGRSEGRVGESVTNNSNRSRQFARHFVLTWVLGSPVLFIEQAYTIQ